METLNLVLLCTGVWFNWIRKVGEKFLSYRQKTEKTHTVKLVRRLLYLQNVHSIIVRNVSTTECNVM